MSFRPVITKIARRTAYGLGGLTIAGGTAITAYTYTEKGLGLRREIRFWSRIVPIVFDYWWHISSSSPFVKLQDFYNDDVDDVYAKDILENTVEAVANNNNKNITTNEENDDHHEEYKNEAQKAMYNKLHNRNAPKILSIMIDLGSLYIKLGQVLSVTALPVPSQYREKFRQLQSSVPGHSEFETVIKPTLEREFGRPIEEIFESIEEIPCGAASIGQAHRAKLLLPQQSTDDNTDSDTDSDSDSVANSNSNNSGTTIRDVVIKVQYPDAKWQVPADVQCVGDFLQLCVYFGVVDESSSKLSYEEFSRQFLAELDYKMERQNLQEVYESSLDKDAPYIKRGVEIPKVFPELCTSQVITMSYLPGPKFEEEARKQLESLGINTSRGVRSIIREETKNEEESDFLSRRPSNKSLVGSFSSSSSSSSSSKTSWMMKFAENMGTFVGVDNILSLIRLARKALLWSTAAAVRGIQIASNTSTMIVSPAWLEWAKNHENAASQADMLEWTNDAIDALFDIHGYQIFNQGLFNADAHPGNILIIQNDDDDNNNNKKKKRNTNRKLGLIDYGQCKRLNLDERRRVAKLIVSVADDESDEQIASNFRDLGIITKNDSTRFLSSFARLMFGKFRNEYLKRDWHKSLHEEDQVVYFPNELSMVYRASLLLRGLAMSFQINVSVGEKWRQHAQTTLLLDQVGCENLES